MKRLVLLVSLVIASVNLTFAQKAEEIIAKFNDATKIAIFDKEKAKNMSMQIEIDAQGQKMPVSVVKVGDEKMRFEMSMMGQMMVMVLNGSESFMIVPGQGIQDIPAAQVKEQGKQMDVIGNFLFDTKDNGYTVKSQEGDCYVIEQFKVKNPKKIIATIYFNKTTGLIDRIDSRDKGVDAVTKLSDYKEYGGVKLPSVMSVEAQGQTVKMNIKNIEFDFPVLPYMFARPE